MKKGLILSITISLLMVLLMSTEMLAADVLINEIRANNDGTDDAEFIELIGIEVTEITDYKIKHYNQDYNHQWTQTIGTFSIPNDGFTDNQGKPIGFYVLGCAGFSSDSNIDENRTSELQNNGSSGADLIILYDDGNNIIDAIAWGSPLKDGYTALGLTRSGDPSGNNYLHLTMNDTDDDMSLQAPDDVVGNDGSGWQLADATIGSLNSNQTSGDISLPVTLTSFTATPGNAKVTLSWTTESEVENLGFNIYKSLYSNEQFSIINDQLIPGHGNTSSRNEYQYIDRNVINGIEYWYQLEDVSHAGETEKHNIVSAIPKGREELGMIPNDFQLFPCYPNPFNPTTKISFNIPENSHVILSIIDLRGNLVITLIDRELQQNQYEVTWNGKDAKNRIVGNGIYFYQLMTNKGFKSMGKMVFLR